MKSFLTHYHLEMCTADNYALVGTEKGLLLWLRLSCTPLPFCFSEQHCIFRATCRNYLLHGLHGETQLFVRLNLKHSFHTHVVHFKKYGWLSRNLVLMGAREKTNKHINGYTVVQIHFVLLQYTADCTFSDSYLLGQPLPRPEAVSPQTLGAVWPSSTGGAQHPAPVAGGRDGGIISRVCGDDFRDRILHLDCVLGFDGRSVTLDLVDHILVFHLQVSLDPWPSMTSDPCKETITNMIYSIGATLNLQYTNNAQAWVPQWEALAWVNFFNT